MDNEFQKWVPEAKPVATLEESLKKDLLWLLTWPGWVYRSVHVIEMSSLVSYVMATDELVSTLKPSFVMISDTNIHVDVVTAKLDNDQILAVLQYKFLVTNKVLGRAFAVDGDLDKENKKGDGWTWVK